MQIIVSPYRWTFRTFWKNFTSWGWDIRNGVRNLCTFFEAVWWFRSWDWSGMVHLLEVSARELHKDQMLGRHVGSEKEARRLLVVAELCTRLRDDSYFEQAGYNPKTWKTLPDSCKKRAIKHSAYMAGHDAEYLGRMLRFVHHWWS